MSYANAVLLSDDPSLTKTVREVVEQVRGCRFYRATTTDEVLQALHNDHVSLVIYHLVDSTDESAVAKLIREAGTAGNTSATLVVSEAYAPEQTLKLLRMGVVDCLCRPLDLRRLAFLVDSLTLRGRYEPALQAGKLQPGKDVRPAPPPSPPGEDAFSCWSPEMARIMRRVRKVSGTDTSILITGETGSGKTRLARWIHRLSPRRDAPLIVVNCGSLPEHLIESELFGHRKGAFTGAVGDREGKFAAAANGTLLLDEVDALPLAAQCKLLRAVDERVFEAVGSNESQYLQARLIIASNRNLEQEVADGRFRSDLYFRLNVVEFRLPPLRKWRTAIQPLAERFLLELAARNNSVPPVLSPEVLKTLESYHWPGNIRELRNVLERAFAFCSHNVVRLADLPERLHPNDDLATEDGNADPAPRRNDTVLDDDWPAGLELSDSAILRRVPHLSGLGMARVKGEVRRIVEVLQRTGNNRSKAARELGISRVALYKKLHKYGLMNVGDL